MKRIVLALCLVGSQAGADVSLSQCVDLLDSQKRALVNFKFDMELVTVFYPTGPIAAAAAKTMADYDANMQNLITVMTAVCKASN